MFMPIYTPIYITGVTACRFVPGEDGLQYERDHISQMLIFCGHQPWCRHFDSKFVLQAAKRNVETIYEVVGGICISVCMSLLALPYTLIYHPISLHMYRYLLFVYLFVRPDTRRVSRLLLLSLCTVFDVPCIRSLIFATLLYKVLEDMDMTLAVLEYKLPIFFRGAQKVSTFVVPFFNMFIQYNYLVNY